MKKALHYWGLPQDIDLEQKLILAHETGFDGVELALRHEGDLNDRQSTGELKAIRRMADGIGIEIHSITSLLNWEASTTSERPEIRKKAENAILKQIDVASALGADALLALPGFVACDFSVGSLCAAGTNEEQYNPANERVDYDKAYCRAVECFRNIAPYAERSGITVCVENIWNHFLLSPLEMRSFLDDIGSEYVRSYFDVANCMPHGYSDQWIRILGKRIKRVHFKDYLLSVNSLAGFVDLLQGDVDYRKVMEAFAEIGYDGWVTAELNAPAGDRGETARSAIKAMNDIIRGV